MNDDGKPGFILHAPVEVAEAAVNDRAAIALVDRYGRALRVGGRASVVDETGDREDWIEQACRVLSCLDAAMLEDVPVWSVDRRTCDLSPLNHAAADAKPADRPLIVWGLFDGMSTIRLRRRGLDVDDPFGVPPRYGVNPGFLANAGRRFVPCKVTHDDNEHLDDLSLVSDVLRSFHGTTVVHKVLDGRAKEYAVRRFVPTEAEPMPEDVALSLLHREGDLHSIQEAVSMDYEYRVMVVDGAVVTGAGSVMEHTPLDRPAGMGIFAPWARRDVRGKGAPERPAAVQHYAEAAQGLVQEVLGDPTFPRHFVMDLFTTDAGGVGIVEFNPLNGSGFFANDAWAVASAAMKVALAPGRSPTP